MVRNIQEYHLLSQKFHAMFIILVQNDHDHSYSVGDPGEALAGPNFTIPKKGFQILAPKKQPWTTSISINHFRIMIKKNRSFGSISYFGWWTISIRWNIEHQLCPSVSYWHVSPEQAGQTINQYQSPGSDKNKHQLWNINYIHHFGHHYPTSFEPPPADSKCWRPGPNREGPLLAWMGLDGIRPLHLGKL